MNTDRHGFRISEKSVFHLCRSVARLTLPPHIPDAVTEPAGGNDFLLGVKLDAFFPLNVEIAVERFVPTGERKHRHRRRHANVDPNHAGLYSTFEFARRFSGVGENGGAI